MATRSLYSNRAPPKVKLKHRAVCRINLSFTGLKNTTKSGTKLHGSELGHRARGHQAELAFLWDNDDGSSGLET